MCRLAATNGDRPPGRQVFEVQTGVRYAEWFCVYWARWADAQSEAEFTPKQIQGRSDRDEAAELVHSIKTDDPPGIEAYWHRRFSDRRANGEWFRRTPADVLAFKRRKFQ